MSTPKYLNVWKDIPEHPIIHPYVVGGLREWLAVFDFTVKTAQISVVRKGYLA